MSTDWDEVGYVISSTYRIEVMRRLADSPAPTSKIAQETDCAVSHVSRALTDLRERGLVELLVPEARRKGRIYGITDHGEEVWRTIEAKDLI